MLAEENGLVNTSESKQTELVCSILKYAVENPKNDLSLGTISDKFDYTREHLSRLLHKYLQENWNTFVNRIRVKKADNMIKQNQGTILDILYECGFDSPNTFYRAYKKEFKKSPKQR